MTREARAIAHDHMDWACAIASGDADREVHDELCDRLTADIEADRSASQELLREAVGLLKVYDVGESSGCCVNAGTFPSECAWPKEWTRCWEHRRREWLAKLDNQRGPI